jgi:hypothetical protein
VKTAKRFGAALVLEAVAKSKKYKTTNTLGRAAQRHVVPVPDPSPFWQG